ncbi:glycoside hydrolase superfamily [Penicillium samsonianum]|uniref:glycoside hydrolase superfamily n=1 Tax=Penicillium samsonianum TaxID=1882272 RepID=UPI00254673AC|nr:glycoside hydrolase superfamily [Penicillium samsonianum]KAJ6140120.1 glycoside hydrolase superfamily [Penicillium samsonianum]
MPDFSTASKTNDSSCNSRCSTEPSSSCGGTYVMSLYKIVNPQGNVTNTGFVPACRTQPLCSHHVCDTSLSIAERVDSLVNSLTLEEKILNVVDASALICPSRVAILRSYIRNFIPGLQGDDPKDKQVIATCKHFAVYDLETGRYGNNYNPTQQDLSDYFLAPFKTCVHDTDVGSVMCTQKALNFTADYHYVVSDCGAVTDIWQYHNFTDTAEGAASAALNAGVDLECGSSYLKLNESLAANQTLVEVLDQALTRLYSALFTVGFFDGGKYNDLDFSNVSTPVAQALAYEAAVEGMTPLKNDKLLPLGSSHKYKSIAVIGPFANATTQMQGDYSGNAPFLISPLEAFESDHRWKVNYALGTEINNQSTTRFGLSKLSKPMIVVQFGGGQVDDSILLKDKGVQALVWAGYPSQSGGSALLDVLLGRRSLAGRLPVTQYPASYADQVSIFDINLRPNMKDSYPGRTYKWYTGKSVIPFGYGLHYTEFKFKWEETLNREYNIQQLVASCQRSSDRPVNDNTPFTTVKARVKNVGHETSDYVSLLFLSSKDAGPTARPNKSLVSYLRLHNITSGSEQISDLPLTLSSLARADENGSFVIFPGRSV